MLLVDLRYTNIASNIPAMVPPMISSNTTIVTLAPIAAAVATPNNEK